MFKEMKDMKQNIHTKLFALTLTTALALTALTACGNRTSPRPPAPAPPSWKRAAVPWGLSS